MLRFFRITDNSLFPEYREGDFALVAGLPRLLRSLKRGDVVVFRHSRHGVLIKRVEHMGPEAGHVFVVGTNANSVDSRQFGPVEVDQLLGKVIWHVKKSSP
jgi:hypothetical protein